MMKVLSKHGSFLPFALRMYEAGNTVLTYIDEEGARELHQGMTPKASDVAELDIKPKDIVVVDMVGFGKGADILRKHGSIVIGAGSFADEIELNRALGFRMMKKAGLSSPPSRSFTCFEDAKNFVKESGKRYVFKPDGNKNTSLTYVSDSAENLLAMFPYFKGKLQGKIQFELQEFVAGVEMSTEMWFNGERFIHPANSTMEEKKLFPGNCGPNTGCMGNIVWAWDMETSQLIYKNMFEGIEKELRASGYIGPLDINAIWNKQGIWGLEFTARFGYDALQAFDQLLEIPMYEFLSNLKGMKQLPIEPNPKKFGGAVRVSIPPFPHTVEDVPQIPILGISKDILPFVYLSDVTMIDGQLHTGGYDGYVLTVADFGYSVDKVMQRIYTTIDKISLTGKQFRNDIGERVKEDSIEIKNILKSLK